MHMMQSFKSEALKVNLKLAMQRLKLLQNRKIESSKKNRKEIAEFIASDKLDRAKIKVEQIIREDYVVEALEILENFCEVLLSRLGLIMAQSNVDESLVETVVTLIWVAPRLGPDIPELKTISKQLQLKYGKQFFDTAVSNCLRLASTKVVDCLTLQPPSSALVERYLKAIADTYNLSYEPQIKDLNSELNLIDKEFAANHANSPFPSPNHTDNSAQCFEERTISPDILVPRINHCSPEGRSPCPTYSPPKDSATGAQIHGNASGAQARPRSPPRLFTEQSPPYAKADARTRLVLSSSSDEDLQKHVHSPRKKQHIISGSTNKPYISSTSTDEEERCPVPPPSYSAIERRGRNAPAPDCNGNDDDFADLLSFGLNPLKNHPKGSKQ